MADFTQIIQEINDDINTNGVGAITGAKLNEVLRDMIAAVNAAKQDPLTIDAAPTEDSTNPVQSGGVYEALEAKLDKEELYIRLGFPVFDASLYYSQGDLVVYNGDLYVFTTSHHGQWDAGDVEYHDINKELKDLYVDLAEQIDAKQDTISDLSTIRSGAEAGATAYQKPSGGIPKTDLASGVQTSLGKADTAYQKPSSGIPQSDLSSDVQSQLNKHFKGWFASVGYLETEYPSPVVGDYAYIKGAESTDPAAIYECTTAGSWSDSGRTADTSNVQTFASGEEVNEIFITGAIADNNKLPTAKAVFDELYVQGEGHFIKTPIDYVNNPNNSIISNQGKWVHSTSGNYSVSIELPTGLEQIRIVRGDSAIAIAYAFLVTNNCTGHNVTADLETGYTKMVVDDTHSEIIVNVPSDAHYLVLSAGSAPVPWAENEVCSTGR